MKFRPGGFRSFAPGPVIELADRRIPAADLFGPEVDDVNRAVLRRSDTDAMVGPAEEFLLRHLPDPDPVAGEVAAMVDAITTDPALFRVGQAAEALHVSVRTLQRLFAEYVGRAPSGCCAGLACTRRRPEPIRGSRSTGRTWPTTSDTPTSPT